MEQILLLPRLFPKVEDNKNKRHPTQQVSPKLLNFSLDKHYACGSGKLYGWGIILKLLPAWSERFCYSQLSRLSQTAVIFFKTPLNPSTSSSREHVASGSPLETQHTWWMELLILSYRPCLGSRGLCAQVLGCVLSSISTNTLCTDEKPGLKPATEIPPPATRSNVQHRYVSPSPPKRKNKQAYKCQNINYSPNYSDYY